MLLILNNNKIMKKVLLLVIIAFGSASKLLFAQQDECDLGPAQEFVYSGEECNEQQPLLLTLNNSFDTDWEKKINLPIGNLWNSRTWGLSTNYYYKPNGNFVIIAKQEPLINMTYNFWEGTVGSHNGCNGWSDFVNSPGMVTVTRDFQFTSGEITSNDKFYYGVFEMSCKLPAGPGFWPAFWLFGYNQPIYNELDIFEFVHHDNIHQYMTVHVDVNGDGNAMNFPESCGAISPDPSTSGIDYSTGFHKFTCRWTKDKIEWLVDDVVIRTLEKYHYYNLLGEQITCDNMIVGGAYIRKEEKVFPTEPMNIIIGFGDDQCDFNSSEIDWGPNSATLWPAELEIEYVKVWQFLSPCCIPIKLYENSSNLPEYTHVSNEIIAGSDAGIPNTNGDVIIQSGQNVSFYAGNQIILKDGFIAESGSQFIARIESCTQMNAPNGEAISLNDFPGDFSPDGDGIEDNLMISVNGATSYTISVCDKDWPHTTFYHRDDVPIYSNPVCVWDGSCNTNCNIYQICNRNRTVSILFKNCDNSLFESNRPVRVTCSNKNRDDDSLPQENASTKVLNRYNPTDSNSYEEQIADFSFFLTPNPATNWIHIEYYNNSNNESKFVLIDAQGRKCLEAPLQERENTQFLDISSLSNGIYFYHVIYTSVNVKHGKIVIARQ